MVKLLRKISIGAIMFLPLLVYAQTVKGFFKRLIAIVTVWLIPLFATLVIALFVYGIVKFIAASGDPNKRKDAKMYIIVGLIALFFLVAFWALIQVLLNTFFEGSVPSQPAGFPPEFF